jgi:hypothetical protein
MANIRFKLGKLAPKNDPKTLKFKSYLSSLPPIPSAIDWTPKVADWQMLGNDEVGDCTCASAMHLEMLWTSQTSTEYVPSTADTLFAYSAITGYNPTDPSTDNGANEENVLNWWKQNGFGSRKPILGFMQIDTKNLAHIKAAITIFGGVYAGVQMPDNAQDQFQAGQPWSNSSKTIEGGHAIPLVAYDPNYMTCITWGAKQKIDYQWLGQNLEEAYAVLSPDWLTSMGVTPNGFNLTQLWADLNQVS